MTLHSSFETTEPGLAEEFLSRAYVELSLRLPDDHTGFRLTGERIDPGPFQLDQMAIGATASFAYRPEEQLFATCVRGRHRGRLPLGFSSPSRFAERYRGVSPSETLRR